MESIFNVIDIWLNIIPYIDYRTFYIIKRLNQAINRDCYIKRKPVFDNLKNWSFYLKPPETKEESIKDTSEWKQIKKKKRNPKTYQTDLAFIERVKTLDYISFTKFLTSYLPSGDENHQLEHCISMLIPGDTIDIKMDQVMKAPYKFYFDGSSFIKMNYTMDHGNWESYYDRGQHDWEEKWIHNYQNEYVYPEQMLHIVGDNLNKFLQENRCLIHINYFLDQDDHRSSFYDGHYWSYNIGMHEAYSTYHFWKGIRAFYDIHIVDFGKLKTVEQPIYAFKSH